MQFICSNLINTAFVVVSKIGSQTLNTNKVGIQTTTANLITTGFGNHCFAKTSYHRAYQHHRSPQTGTFLQKFITLQIGQIYTLCFETISINTLLCNCHPHISHQLNKIINVQNVGNVIYYYFLSSKQCSADNLQHFVFSTLRMNLSTQFVPSFDYK